MSPAVQPITSPEQLFTQWQRGLFVAAQRILRSTEDAEDCVQEAGLRMVRSWSSCNPATAQAWAFAIVRNQAFDILRKRRVKTQATEEPFGTDGRLSRSGKRIAVTEELAMPSHEAEVIARLTLEGAVSQLTGEERKAFDLWVDHRRSIAQVGAKMHSREYRTIHRLRHLCRAAC